MKLYMVMLGCTPPGRFTEQHDIFFGIGESLGELVPHMIAFWPEAQGKIHIDAWREVTVVDDYQITIVDKINKVQPDKLFFINLGGYKKNEFEEYHYKVLAVGKTLGKASKKAKATSFYKHFGFKGAESHIDDKYGIGIDEIYKVEDILSNEFTDRCTIQLEERKLMYPEDKLHIGYVGIEKLTARK